mgnify:CR=1 FL=1
MIELIDNISRAYIIFKLIHSFILERYVNHRDLHSFPTRRSTYLSDQKHSDLLIMHLINAPDAIITQFDFITVR